MKMPRLYKKKYTKRYSAKSKLNYFRAKANYFKKIAASAKAKKSRGRRPSRVRRGFK